MTRSLVIEQPFDLALTLEMGQTFRWRRRGDEGEDWYSGVLDTRTWFTSGRRAMALSTAWAARTGSWRTST